MELVIKFRDEEHVETLNSFREGELLNITSEADIKMKMEKSFGLNTETLSKILHQELARKDWVNLAHWAIDIANKTSAETQKRKGDAKQTDRAKIPKTDGKSTIDGDKVRHFLHDQFYIF